MRLFLLAIVSTFMAVLVACGGGGGESPTATPKPPVPTPPSRPAEAAPTAAPAAPTGGGDLVARGQELAASLGCVGCHSLDGSPGVGPTWKGLFGKTRELAGGGSVTADEDYIAESIRDPGAKVAKGFQAIMPPFADLSDEEVAALVEYIKTLK